MLYHNKMNEYKEMQLLAFECISDELKNRGYKS